MTQRVHLTLAAAFWTLLAFAILPSLVFAAEEPVPPPQPVTTGDPELPVEALISLLTPLTKDGLLIEADGWQALVKAKAEEIAQAEILVQRQNQEIAAAEEVKAKAQETQDALEAVADQAEEAQTSGDADAMEAARDAAERAEAAMSEVLERVDEATEAADETREAEDSLPVETLTAVEAVSETADEAEAAVGRVGESVDSAAAKGDAEDVKAAAKVVRETSEEAQGATQRLKDEAQAATEEITDLADQTQTVGAVAQTMDAATEQKQEEKVDLLEAVNTLREERTQLIDRFKAVLDELDKKTDPEDTETLAKIKDYRLYATAVAGIRVDLKDTTSAWVAIKGWLTSEEGGLRWAKNIGLFLAILIAAWILSKLFSRGVHRALRASGKASQLLEHFLVGAVRWVLMIGGFLMALSALEISVGPLLALVGAAGFVVAFALQDSLSNFASGLMILFFRPFDVGDAVEAGGVSGTVQSLNLVSTTIKTFDNQEMVIPNNKIWNDVITNITGVATRRVDMEFGIRYSDDMDRAQAILEEIVKSHPKVLADPAPTIRLNTLADSSVNFICRPWAKTGDYWEVYWDVTKAVKQRFDEEGIGIPFPQQDVHLHIADDAGRDVARALAKGRPAGVGPSDQPFEQGEAR